MLLESKSPYLLFETEAILVFPDKKVLHDAYIKQRILKVQIDEAEELYKKEDIDLDQKVEVKVSDLKELLNQPSNAELLVFFKQAFLRDGPMAGDVLAAMYLMMVYDLTSKPSANKAISFLVSLYRGKKNRLTGRALPISEKPIKKNWKKYRLSSPIWAAMSLNRWGYSYCTPGEELQNNESLNLTLRHAASIFEFGRELLVDGSKEPLFTEKDCVLSAQFIKDRRDLPKHKSFHPTPLEIALREYKFPL